MRIFRKNKKDKIQEIMPILIIFLNQKILLIKLMQIQIYLRSFKKIYYKVNLTIYQIRK